MRTFENKTYEIGYIYVGAQVRRSKYGCFKIGETTQTLRARERKIQKCEPSYRMLGCLKIPNATEPQLLAIESLTRLQLSNCKNYGHIGLDHFLYDITDRKKDLQDITATVLDIARKACEQLEIEYIG